MFDLTKIVRKNIVNLKPYSSARDEFTGKEGIFLDANENPFGNLNRYPDPYQKELKELISIRNTIAMEKIFLGNGSDEVIDLVYRVFCDPEKDKALTFSPTYGMYQVSAEINNIELLYEGLDERFNIDLNALRKRLDDETIKLIFICSPNNPTGNCVSKQAIANILEMFDGIVVVDEAYIEFSPDKTAIDLIDAYPNLIITRTMSKAWGFAAARIGMAFTNKAIIQYLNKVKPPYNISELNQKAAIEALKDTARFEMNRKIILQQKKNLIKELSSLELIKRIFPSEANFILVEVDDANHVYDYLVEKKIIIRNRNRQIKNCLRITVGSSTENKELIEILKKLSNEKSTIY